MKRKAGSTPKSKQTKVLKPAKPAVRGAPKKATIAPEEDYYSNGSGSEEDIGDLDYSDEDIGDLVEYMQGEDPKNDTIVEFDDGEVTLNLPAKKGQLFDSDDEEEDEGKGKKAGKLGTTKFSDDNKKLLKLKGQVSDSEDEEEEDDEDDFDKAVAMKAMKIQQKKRAQEQEIQDAQDEMRDQADEEEEESDEDEDEDEGDDIQGIANRMENLHSKIQEYVGVLAEFRERRPKGVTREEFVNELKADLMTYYGYTAFLIDLYFHLFTPAEALSHIEANEVPRPLTIRVNSLKAVRKEIAQSLINKGVSLEPVKWSKVGLVIYESKIPIGATPEYLAGQYMLQSAASFLPVLALEPQPNESILDMCAAPGGKTTYIAALMKNTGTLHANDKNAERIPSLVANLHRMGVKNCFVSQLDGVVIPTHPLKYDRVLVDAPCMGLGVIAKDRSIKATKEEKDMLNCIDIQIKLLLAAIDAVDISKAAVIVYSTCSISVEENEAIVDKALKKRYVKVVDTGLEFGKEGITRYRGKAFHPSLKLSRRYYPHAHNIDGFYVCKLVKFQNGIRTKQQPKAEEEVEQPETKGPLLKPNAPKPKKAAKPVILEDDPTLHVIDAKKEEERAQKNRDKRNRKKQALLARRRANADDDEDADDVEMDDAPPPKAAKVVQPTKAQPTIPSKPSNNGKAPAANGNAKGKGAPAKKLRGSKQ